MRVEHTCTYHGMPKRYQPHESQAVELKQSETVIGMEYQKKNQRGVLFSHQRCMTHMAIDEL